MTRLARRSRVDSPDALRVGDCPAGVTPGDPGCPKPRQGHCFAAPFGAELADQPGRSVRPLDGLRLGEELAVVEGVPASSHGGKTSSPRSSGAAWSALSGGVVRTGPLEQGLRVLRITLRSQSRYLSAELGRLILVELLPESRDVPPQSASLVATFGILPQGTKPIGSHIGWGFAVSVSKSSFGMS